MSGRPVTAASFAIPVVLVAALATGAAQMQGTRSATSVGVGCAYLSDDRFTTVVTNVESSDPSIPVAPGMSCTEAFNALMDGGFDLVHVGPTVERDYSGDGTVDGADYVVWRNTLGSQRKQGTNVTTRCVYSSGAEIRTQITGVEFHIPQQPPLITGMTCAAAFSALLDHGFVPLHGGTVVLVGDWDGDGVADRAGYNVWRANFGATGR